MFGTNLFGTIRFGESPAAVSPVLLSGIGVQGAAVGMSRLRVENSVSAWPGPVAGRSGLGVLVRKLVVSVGVRNADVVVGGFRVVRGVVGRVRQDSVVSVQKLGTGVVLVSNCCTLSVADIRVRLSIVIAADCKIGTASSMVIAFPGLVLQALQSSSSDARTSVARRLVSDAPGEGSTGSATVVVPSILASSSRAWMWTEASIQPSGLLILNVQSSEMRGMLRAGRRLRGDAIQSGAPAVHVLVVREITGAEFLASGTRIVIVGTGLSTRTSQVAGGLVEIPVIRGLGLFVADRTRTASRLTTVGHLYAAGFQDATVVVSTNVWRALSGQDFEEELTRVLLGRMRTLAGYGYEMGFPFGRFAVVPDLSNDRLVIVLREDRRVAIPRQSEQ